MIEINCHSSIKFNGDKIIYVDPYKIENDLHDADIVFLTHDHYDHISFDDLKKVINDDTIIVLPETCRSSVLKMDFDCGLFAVKPNKNYILDDLFFETVHAYNTNKKFHPKKNNWVGYVIIIDGVRYYVAGDTDITPDNEQVRCDVALVPIGGTYTMDYREAAILVNSIKPSVAIPIHYGMIVGDKEDALKFKNLLDEDIECKILI